MTPVDAIWLFLVKTAVARHFVATRPLPTLPPSRNASGINYPSKWLPTLPPPSHPAGMLVVLTTLVKILSKMAGYSASYSFNSWCIGRV